MATKLIYGAGRIPKAFEFALGDIIVNVDDSKVYSKSKSNEVFEIGASTTSLIETQAFTTASLHTGSFDAILTASNSSNLTISGGVGIEITTGSQVNSIILNATGESIASVTVANTASYVQAGNIDGTINISTQTNFNTLDTTGQTAIDLTFPANTNTLTATVPNLDTTSNVQFGSITSSTDISASGDIIASRFIASGSNVTSGFVFPNPDNLTDLVSNRITLTSAKNMQFRAGGNFQFASTAEILASESLMLKNASNDGKIHLENAGTGIESRIRFRTGSAGNLVELMTISGSGNVGIGTTTPGKKLEVSGSISASNDILAKRLRLPQSDQGSISEGGIIFGTEGSHGQILDDGNSLQIGYDGSDVLTISGSDPYIKLLINGNTRIASGHLLAEGNITASGNISASGALFASMSTTDNSNFKTVVYDEDTGKFSITGSYSSGGEIIDGIDKRVLFFDGDNNPVGDGGFTYDKTLNSVTLTGDVTSSGAQIGDLRIVGDKIQPSNTNLTSLEIDGSDARIQFNIGGAQYFKIDKEQGTSEFVLGNTTVSSSFSFFTKGSPSFSTPALHVTSSGKVGIGTINPNEQFEVIGNIKADGHLSASGYLRLASNQNTSGVAGALLYSASNEFYLGFS